LRISCKDPSSGSSSQQLVHEGYWGGWKDWRVQGNQYVTGAQVRFEDSQGKGDDTAMNGIKFDYKPLRILRSFKIDYDLNRKVITTAPRTVTSSTRNNPTQQSQTTRVSYTKSKGQSNTWTLDSSISLTLSASAEVGVPLIGSGSVSMSTTMSMGFSKGQTSETSETDTLEETINLDPCTNTQINVVMFEGKGKIPFTATYFYTDGSSEVYTGTWYGVSQLDSNIDIKILDDNACKKTTTRSQLKQKLAEGI
jgi:hypothetical protein